MKNIDFEKGDLVYIKGSEKLGLFEFNWPGKNVITPSKKCIITPLYGTGWKGIDAKDLIKLRVGLSQEYYATLNEKFKSGSLSPRPKTS